MTAIEGEDPNEDYRPCPECGHPMMAHRQHWCDVDDCGCPGRRGLVVADNVRRTP